MEANEDATALVTVGNSEKFFSPGLDLKFMVGAHKDDVANFILEFIRLLGRLLAFPVPTIALVNGYAVAGGCMFAFAHDYRIMRNDFGYLELSESKLGMPLPPGMMATIKTKTGYSNEFRDLVLLSRRFSPFELL